MTGSMSQRNFKAADLPVSATTRAAIDGLVLTIKKKGDFDWLRKAAWNGLLESVRRPSIHGILQRKKVDSRLDD